MHLKNDKNKVHKHNRGTGEKRKTPVLSFSMYILSAVLIISMIGLLITIILDKKDDAAQQAELESIRELTNLGFTGGMRRLADIPPTLAFMETGENIVQEMCYFMLPHMEALYEENSDIIGWITIEDTQIDYPVMQTPEDENFYLKRSFYGEENDNGCLIMDTDSVVGVGTTESGYESGEEPSTNLIIHGHNMRSGEMFGDLELYEDAAYEEAHSLICFDSLYEHREYEVIAVFYSQVYYASEDVFKYYKFFEAETQEEFDDWYQNIKELSLYDTGVTAEFGDEFITLSTCAYHVEDGRFVVVGRRVE